MTNAPATCKVDVLLGVAYDPDVRVQRETQALAEAGAKVRILAWDRAGTHPQVEYEGAVLIERVHVNSRSARGWTQVFYLLKLLFVVLPRIRRRRPDVIHAVDLPMLLLAVLVAPFAGRPRIVYDAFEIYQVMVSHRLPRPLLLLIRLLEGSLPRVATLVITPGEIRQAWFQRRGVHSVSVPNWSDLPSHPIDRATARANLEIPEDQLCIVYAGALHRSRDLEPLIEHARRTPSDLVIIAGQGDAERALARQAQGLDNVRLTGWLSDPSELLAGADALYYALRPDHPYALLAAPNNLFVAITWAIPLIHRLQGEIAVVGRKHRIGAAFHDAESLERAIDAVRDRAFNAAVRQDLRAARLNYTWKSAARRLIRAYPMNGSASNKPIPQGP